MLFEAHGLAGLEAYLWYIFMYSKEVLRNA